MFMHACIPVTIVLGASRPVKHVDRNTQHQGVVQEMKSLFAELSAKLDALSHLSLTPKPVVTDLEVHAEVPAIAMEEAAPVATSLAAMQAPEEAHAKVSSCSFLS